MMEAPGDIHRLIQQVLAELGFDADAGEIARRVRRLNYGLPAEDELSVLFAWLGRCRLVHKLDQQQVPIASKEQFQVPDLLASFESGGPFLIEVKCSTEKKLSFKPSYHARLSRYAELVRLPLLIAWKFHSMWVLFDIRHLALARTNFNISFDEAMRQNLLGVLAGDVSFKLRDGAGIHLDLAKEALIESGPSPGGGRTEVWQMRVSDFFFTSSRRSGPVKLSAETAQLFAACQLEEAEDHHATYIRKSFVAGAEGMEFAHRALVGLLRWEGKAGEPSDWRSLLSAPQITRTIARFGTALQRGLEEGVVSHIFHQVPATMPDFVDASSHSEEAGGVGAASGSRASGP